MQGRGRAQRWLLLVFIEEHPSRHPRMCHIRCPPFRPKLSDKQMSLSHPKSRHLTISHLCAGPWGQRVWCEPFLRFLLPCESQGREPYWFSNLDVLGSLFSGADFKSRGIGCGIQSFVSQGKALDFEFPCTVGCSVRGGRRWVEREVSGRSVSSPLLPAWMWAFSHLSHA